MAENTDKVLTAKQQRFCEEYLVDLNATKAAIRAGYSKKTAGELGWENLKKPEIQAQVKKLMDERASRTEISQDLALKMLYNFLSANVADYLTFTDKGVVFKRSDELTPEQLACVSEVSEYIGKNTRNRRFKLVSKEKMLALMMKHLGMLDGKPEDKQQINVIVRHY
jgi:phage terminase small subunit